MTRIARGAKGAEVTELQRLLASHGYNPGPIDGEFGPKTEAAVRAAQADLFEPDGVFGPVLAWALGNAKPVDVGTTISGDLAARIVAEAKRYLAADVRERPSGSNKGGPAEGQPSRYSVDAIQAPFGLPGQPWCGMFVHAVLKAAGKALPTGRFAAARAWLEDGPANGASVGAAADWVPRLGDIFLHRATSPSGDHVGIIIGVSLNKVTTIEGNSGDRVASNTRDKAGYITHYIRFV